MHWLKDILLMEKADIFKRPLGMANFVGSNFLRYEPWSNSVFVLVAMFSIWWLVVIMIYVLNEWNNQHLSLQSLKNTSSERIKIPSKCSVRAVQLLSVQFQSQLHNKEQILSTPRSRSVVQSITGSLKMLHTSQASAASSFLKLPTRPWASIEQWWMCPCSSLYLEQGWHKTSHLQSTEMKSPAVLTGERTGWAEKFPWCFA